MVEIGGLRDAHSSVSVKTSMAGGTDVIVNVTYFKSLLPREKEQPILHAYSK